MIGWEKRETIRIGPRVNITKERSKDGKVSKGIVKAILYRFELHPYDIKLTLKNGIIGNEKEVVTMFSTNEEPDKKIKK